MYDRLNSQFQSRCWLELRCNFSHVGHILAHVVSEQMLA